MWMQVLLLAVVQTHRVLHPPPPFLNAAAEQTKEYLQRISQAPLSSVLWERSLAELQRLLQQEQLQ